MLKALDQTSAMRVVRLVSSRSRFPLTARPYNCYGVLPPRAKVTGYLYRGYCLSMPFGKARTCQPWHPQRGMGYEQKNCALGGTPKAHGAWREPGRILTMAQEKSIMFYPLSPTPDTETSTAKCPRCSLPFIVTPVGATAAPLSLPLGEIAEYLQTITDMVAAIHSTIEAQVAR